MVSYFALLIGVLATAFAAIFVRLADAPSLVIAAYRLGLASLILLPIAGATTGAQILRLTKRDWLLLASSGVFLAIHFATWITSLQYTTVASSVALVTSAPIWVALVVFFVLRETVRPIVWAGILIAVTGGALIGGGDTALGARALVGDALALMGAWAGAGYFLIGRRMRAQLSLIAYISTVYTVAAIVLLVLALAAQLSLVGYSSKTYWMFLLLAVIPQIIGHSSYNFALRDLSATLVGVATLGEPIGSTLLAIVFLNEFPQPLVILGGALILAGIAIVSRGEAT